LGVITIALVPVINDKAIIRVFLRGIEEMDSVRNKMEISITNIVRRIVYLDSIEFEYIDTNHIIKNINKEYYALPEGRSVIIITNSYPVTAVSKIKNINVIDSTGKKWNFSKKRLHEFIEMMQNLNHEVPKTITESNAEYERNREIYNRYKDEFFD